MSNENNAPVAGELRAVAIPECATAQQIAEFYAFLGSVRWYSQTIAEGEARHTYDEHEVDLENLDDNPFREQIQALKDIGIDYLLFRHDDDQEDTKGWSVQSVTYIHSESAAAERLMQELALTADINKSGRDAGIRFVIDYVSIEPDTVDDILWDHLEAIYRKLTEPHYGEVLLYLQRHKLVK